MVSLQAHFEFEFLKKFGTIEHVTYRLVLDLVSPVMVYNIGRQQFALRNSCGEPQLEILSDGERNLALSNMGTDIK